MGLYTGCGSVRMVNPIGCSCWHHIKCVRTSLECLMAGCAVATWASVRPVTKSNDVLSGLDGGVIRSGFVAVVQLVAVIIGDSCREVVSCSQSLLVLRLNA